MKASAWNRLKACVPEAQPTTMSWLERMLKRNADCVYLKQWGQPTCLESFRSQVPLTDYDQLEPWVNRIATGESSLLFPGQPVAFEKTGGSSGGYKLVPYTLEGLTDFRRTLLPWLIDIVRRHHITGSAYFSLSPACLDQEYIANIPVGLSDVAYVGEEAGAIFAEVCAVPPRIGKITDYNEWRAQTLYHLKQAHDLELISAWSPTFLLRLFEGKATEYLWPNLKVISCWADGVSAEFVHALQRLFPHVAIEPKGLMSTEAVITIPDEHGQPLLTDTGFFEFRRGGNVMLETELESGKAYEVIATTASGLYRYCTGDMVRYEGCSPSSRAVLHFIGRQELVSDLVGEKLTESFVATCLKCVTGFHMLVPNMTRDGYMLVLDQAVREGITIEAIEIELMANPQYAYARKLRQLKPLTAVPVRNPWQHYEHYQSEQGVRLGDIKPVALRAESHWATLFRGHA